MNTLIGTAEGLYNLDSWSFRGREVTALTAHNGTTWVLLDGRELARRNGDEEWQPIATIDGPLATCVSATKAGVFVGTLEAHLFRLRDHQLDAIDAFEQVEGRETWYTPWGAPADARTISGDANGGVYVNVHVGGIVRSLDGGSTWHPTIDVHADVHQVLVESRSGKVLAATAGGLAESSDAGETWRTSTDGLHARYQRAVAVVGETVLVSASSGPSGSRSALYRRQLNSEAPFERCTDGLPEWFPNNIDSACLDANGSIAAFGTEQAEVYVSEDEGRSWRQLASGLAPVRCVLVR